MKIQITKKFENADMAIAIEDSDDKKALQKALVFTQLDQCGLCKNTSIRWDSNTASTDEGTFIYIKRICRKCGAQSNLSSYKAGGFFWNKWEIYNKDKEVEKTSKIIASKNEQDNFPLDDNLPF